MRAIILAACLLCVSVPTAHAAEHPVLSAFGLESAPAGAELYLLRTARPLPPGARLNVLAQRGHTYLVTGDPLELERLAGLGVDLNRVPAVPRSAGPGRQWQRITTADPQVQYLVDQVTWSGIAAKIGWLQDFGTRWSYSSQCLAAADSLHAFFTDLYLPVEFQDFEHMWNPCRNVIATQVGATYPDSIFVICGHYDSISDQSGSNAPGADDNGSGTAAVLTAAEIFARETFDYTIKYICFSAEEQGLVGSQFYAAWARQQDLQIVGALNFDMLAWWTDGVDFDLELEANVSSVWLVDAIANAADLYTSMPYEIHVDNGAWWGDHASFWGEGYHAVNHEESWDWYDPDFNPFYHSIRDVLEECHPGFALGNTRIAVAALATLAGLVGPTPVTADDRPVDRPLSLAASPNPFNGLVSVTILAPATVAETRLGFYDVAGRLIHWTTVPLREGSGEYRWNLRGMVGEELGAGLYLCRALDVPSALPVKLVYVK
ncbi:MAG: M28 family peptidase [bacterium]